MNNMLEVDKNIKDSAPNTSDIVLKDNVTSISYTKTNKLITALFMVTDVMDKEEPLRTKLRFLGTDIISDTYSNLEGLEKRISETLSFLDIGFAIGIISEMNSNILKREFSELQKSVKEFISRKNPMWLEDFLKEDENINKELDSHPVSAFMREKNNGGISFKKEIHIGHTERTRIGVQKGGTLLQALSRVEGKALSDKVNSFQTNKNPRSLSESQGHSNIQNYDILKKRRRDEIISIIKNKMSVLPESDGATITDIKNMAEGLPAQAGALVSCGEKTLQRELVSMVHDGVLKKTGEKRWSKYKLISSN
jgi:hypothetical protein